MQKTYYNEYWMRASVEETPDKANNVEMVVIGKTT